MPASEPRYAEGRLKATTASSRVTIISSFAESRYQLTRWSDWYNTGRPHQALGYRSPRKYRKESHSWLELMESLQLHVAPCAAAASPSGRSRRARPSLVAGITSVFHTLGRC
jgi:Integrase core domain